MNNSNQINAFIELRNQHDALTHQIEEKKLLIEHEQTSLKALEIKEEMYATFLASTPQIIIQHGIVGGVVRV